LLLLVPVLLLLLLLLFMLLVFLSVVFSDVVASHRLLFLPFPWLFLPQAQGQYKFTTIISIGTASAATTTT